MSKLLSTILLAFLLTSGAEAKELVKTDHHTAHNGVITLTPEKLRFFQPPPKEPPTSAAPAQPHGAPAPWLNRPVDPDLLPQPWYKKPHIQEKGKKEGSPVVLGIALTLIGAYVLIHLLMLIPAKAWGAARGLVRRKKWELLAPAACIVLLTAAMWRQPHGYYTFLRISICVWSITALVKHRHPAMRLLLAGAGILYNPLIPITLSRDTWHILNAVTIALTLLAALTPTCAESAEQTCEETTTSRSE